RRTTSQASRRPARSDDFSGAEPRDLLPAVAELFQDLVGVLAEGRRAVTEASGRLREVDGRRRQRRRPREPWILRVPKEACGPDGRLLQSLRRRLEGPRRNPRGLELGERLRRRALGSPLAHALRDGFTVIPAREVVLEPWVGEPVVLAHQLGPAPEH